MKKIMLLGAFAIIANSSFAQLFVSGGLGFNTSSTKTTSGSVTNEGDKYLSFSITPRVGYFFTEHIVAGLDLSFSSDRTKYANSDNKLVTRGFGGGPFVRYVHKFNEYFGVWGEFRASVNTDKTQYNGDDRNKSLYTSTGVVPGLLVFAGKHLSFEFSYGGLAHSYSRNTDLTSSNEPYTTYSGFGLVLNPGTARFAVNYTF